MARRSGLGKGLGALIPTEPAMGESVYREISIGDIVPNPYQPRGRFDEENLGALTASVAELGVIQPVVVREVEGGYELVAGERRWRAASRAGLATIPALVRVSDDEASLVTAVVENLHRQDLNPLEEAAAYQQLLEDFAMTQQEVASRVGRSRSAVTNTIRLLQLPPAVQGLLADGRISAGHARALLGAPDADTQEALAAEIIANDLTVRQIEDRVRPSRPTEAETDGRSGAGEARRSADAPPEPAVLELEELLAARLATRVSVKLAKGTGKITIDFADLDDLERIYRIITPPGTVI